MFEHPSSLGFKGLFERPDSVNQPLYVITPIFNTQRFRKRWDLYEKFQHYVKASGAILYTIELAFGERQFAVTSANNPYHIQVRTGGNNGDRVGHELWTKESLINLALTRLPPDWVYVAWIDADITFKRPDWVGETLQQLQHYQVVQMFSQAEQLDIKYEVLQTYLGFMYCYHNRQSENIPALSLKSDYYYTVPKSSFPQNHSNKINMAYWHPGFAWAARRDALNSLGGLIDYAILGSADYFMAKALIGAFNTKVRDFNNLGVSGSRWFYEWQRRAETFIRRNVGYVSGGLTHYWHGSRAKRRYKEREQILIDCKYDPELDLIKNTDQIWQLTERNLSLRDEIRKYFAQRDEDATS